MAYPEGSGDGHRNFVNFNQDYTSLAIGTKQGYRIFALNDVDRLEQTHCSTEQTDVALVERLFNSSLVAVVNLPSSRNLKIRHLKKGSEITNHMYPNAILAVKLNRARLIVCLEESLYIHNIKDMKILHAIKDTPPNRKGICALSPLPEKCNANYLAFPSSSTTGEVQIFDTETLTSKTTIQAHTSALAALAFNLNGSLLATASEKGTVIRVFAVLDGNRLYELRRGMKRCARIYSLAFNPDSTLLACSSNTETIHVFKLDENNASNTRVAAACGSQEDQSWMNLVGRFIQTGTNFLPGTVTDVFTQERYFAFAKMSPGNSPSVVGLITINHQCHLLVACTNGTLYIYNVDTEHGGECTFYRQHNILDNNDPPQAGGVVLGEAQVPGDDDDDEHGDGAPHKYQA